VEGEDDRVAITALLRSQSAPCCQALDSGVVALDTLSGASNLAYKASLVRSALCSAHAFLDDDPAARNAFERARLEGLLDDSDVNWATSEGMSESELEDLYDPALYAAMIQNSYRVSLEAPEFRSASKWSQRMERTFRRQGQRWDERIEKEVKVRIADLVAASTERALLHPRRSAFDGFAAALEQRLHELGARRTGD